MFILLGHYFVQFWLWSTLSKSTLTFPLGLPPSYCSLSTHGAPALLGSLAGLLLAGLAEEKSGSMQVVTDMEANDVDDQDGRK